MIKVGIIGATGYAGGELVRLLLGHNTVEIKWLASKSYQDQSYASVFRNMFQIVPDICKADDFEKMAEEVDVIFTATPQGYLGEIINNTILEKTKIIDLSADFRLKNVSTYEEWYKIKHKSPQFLQEAVYGLCELNRQDIKHSRLVANPGCFTTCSILTAYPLIKEGLIEEDSLIIDAKSGTSGAGRSAKTDNLLRGERKYKSVWSDNTSAYTGDRRTAWICSRKRYLCNIYTTSCTYESGNTCNRVCKFEKR